VIRFVWPEQQIILHEKCAGPDGFVDSLPIVLGWDECQCEVCDEQREHGGASGRNCDKQEPYCFHFGADAIS
jgi:hypothetical protein